MHSSHLSAALLPPFECSSPTPRCKSTVYHGNRPNRRNQSLKEFTFSAKGWDKNNVQLQTVQHPKLAATNSEPRMSWRFSNFWRNQSATSQGGEKKMRGNSNLSRYKSVQWLWLWWLCCKTQLCLSSSLPCGWQLGTEPELAHELASLIGAITSQGTEELTSLLWVLDVVWQCWRDAQQTSMLI